LITLIEANNYRCLRYARGTLGPFHVLVGPNASGKTTFLDVIPFLGRLLADGPEAAIEERSRNFYDLVWRREGESFEVAIEARIPESRRSPLPDPKSDTIRYEVGLGLSKKSNELEIRGERVLLKHACNSDTKSEQRELFPLSQEPPDTIISTGGLRGTRTVVSKIEGGNDNFYSEVHQGTGKGWIPSYKLGPRKSALANLPEDESRFPASTWLKGLLSENVQQLVLNSRKMRNPSPPGKGRGFSPDGSNLPWVVESLNDRSPHKIREWVAHLRTALPDLEDIGTIERPEDKFRYLVLKYKGGLSVPSWMASDGTLRLLALTLPAYLPDLESVFLIEEPENGIHPMAVETMYQSLSSVYDAQVLMATHSPVILSLVEADKVLCFARTEEGATDIVAGSEHPALKDWRGEENLGVLFAGGVLG